MKDLKASFKGKKIYLSNNPIEIAAINIPSMGGGKMNPFKTKKSSVYLEDEKKKLDNFSEQNFGDGKLEFATLGNACNLICEAGCKG